MELQVIQSKIYEIRGRRVMLDFDLAELYQVETKTLNRAVKRNLERFPERFMFQLDKQEVENLRCQFGTSSAHGGTRYMPYAFTEQGVSMLAAVLRSPVAIQVNIEIIRAFVEMRNYIANTTTLTAEIAELRATIELLRRDDEETLEAVNDLSEDTRKHIDNLYNAIGELSIRPVQVQKPRNPIGYK